MNMDNTAKKIKILPKGPYRVSKEIPLDQAIIVDDGTGASERWDKGRKYDAQTADYHLCRCGHSQNKPYCDGTHVAAGFEGRETASKAPYTEDATVYEGKGDVDLLDNEAFCAVARFCDADPTVWSCAVESDRPGFREKAIEKACNCPSGRLTVARKDGTMIEQELGREISLVEDTAQGCKGPLWVKGGIPIEGADGETYEVRNRVTLCRCGNSRNAPFCDASHLRAAHMKGLDE